MDSDDDDLLSPEERVRLRVDAAMVPGKDWDKLSREDQRQMRVDYCMREATQLGINLTRDDFEHVDIEKDLPELYMTDAQIKKIMAAERRFVERQPTPPKPEPPRAPEPVHASHNVVRLDKAIRSAVSDALKQRLVAYAPIERLYSMISAWRYQEREFASAKMLLAHLERFGCTCITQNVNDLGGTWQFSMDIYYHKKKEDAQKKKQRRKEVRTALKVARNTQRISTLRRHAAGAGSDESGSDEEFDSSRALAAARGGLEMPEPPSATGTGASDVVDQDEIAAFADDHAQLVVEMRREDRGADMCVTDVYFLVCGSTF